MPIRKFWVIAYRDLGRNRRRTILTGAAVALGLALIIVLSGWIAGALENSLQNNIRLITGLLQIRADSYEEEKVSLLWQDLVEEPVPWRPRMRLLARGSGPPSVSLSISSPPT